MTLVREAGSIVVTQFMPPLRGTWNAVAANTVPSDAVYESSNVFVRFGRLRRRPGLAKLSDGNHNFADRVIGGTLVVTPSATIVIAITRDRLFQLDTSAESWASLLLDEGTSEFAVSDNAVVDTALMQTSGQYVAIIASQNHPLRKWTAETQTVVTLTGTGIPKAKSVCISSTRVVALTPPHTITWSRILNPAHFDPTAFALRGQTGDNGICVRALSALSFVLYKERSIHVARAQAGLDDSTAFSFREPLIAEGPAGIHAVVDVGGYHMYMTRSGRIGVFDGAGHPKWIADGIWSYLQGDINPGLTRYIRGIYDYRLHTVTFFYPKLNTTGLLQGMVVINLPFEGVDLSEPGISRAFLGICAKSVMHVCEIRSTDAPDRSLIFAATVGTGVRQAYTYDENAMMDGDSLFECSFRTGLVSMPDARHTTVTIETFAERGPGYGAVLVEPIVSHSLETEGGTVIDASGQWINLESVPVQEYQGFGQQTRFFGLRYSWASNSTFKYSGTVVYGSGLQKFTGASPGR